MPEHTNDSAERTKERSTRAGGVAGRRAAPEPRDDETELVASLRAGDEAVFEFLIDLHHGSLLRLAMVYTRSRAVAEEIVQDTWLGVLKGIHRFEGRSSLKTWIFRILLNRARSVITLRDVEACTASEVCDLLAISEGNQRVILHRARSKVRQALEVHLAVETS